MSEPRDPNTEILIGRLARLFDGSGDLPAQPPEVIRRILVLLAAGEAFQLRLVAAGRAGDFFAALDFSDALFEAVPALRAVHTDAFDVLGHGDAFPAEVLKREANADSGQGGNASSESVTA